MEFAEYAIKYSKDARESRKTIPPALLQVLEEIEADLAENPKGHPDRIVPVSRNGSTFVYRHQSPAIEVTFEIDAESKILYFFHFAAPSLQVQRTLFVSYSHKDREWLAKLRLFLSVLEQQGMIKFWDDEQLEAGKPWEEQIIQALESAVAGVLLVSQEFLTSEFIKAKELPKLLDAASQKGKKIFWIHISPSTVFNTHKEITKYQSLMQNPAMSLEELDEAQQKKALVMISQKLQEAMSLQ
jgi:hypothetical protein